MREKPAAADRKIDAFTWCDEQRPAHPAEARSHSKSFASVGIVPLDAETSHCAAADRIRHEARAAAWPADGHAADFQSCEMREGNAEAALSALQQQLAAVQRAAVQRAATTISLQHSEERRARGELEQRIGPVDDALHGGRPAQPAVGTPTPTTRRTTTVSLAATRNRPGTRNGQPDASKPAPRDAAPPWLTVLHVEGRTPFREAVRAAVEQFRYVRYVAKDTERTVEGPVLLVINLLAVSGDPLATTTHVMGHCGGECRAFAYCAAGTSGMLIGLADVFPHPFDPDACATRLLARPGNLQRVLAVTEAEETMGGVRAIVKLAQCVTSVAFDKRHAQDMLPIVNPDVILVDLALPRGEGLRLVSWLKSDPKTASIPLSLFCSQALDPAEFHFQMQRITRTRRFSTDDLAAAITRVLAGDTPASAQHRG